MSYTFSELIKQLPLSFKRAEKVKLMGNYAVNLQKKMKYQEK